MKIIDQRKMTDTKIITASSMPEFNPTENWNLWFERLELHFVEIECTDEKQKISILLKLIGAEAYQILHCLFSPKLPSKEKYNDLCALMKAHYTPPVIVFNERRNFYAAKMGADERVASWFARVKRLSLDCKFVAGDLERIVLDKFVVELPSKIFEKLCEEDETLTLQTALKKAMMKETKIQQSQNSSVDVNFIKARGKQSSSNGNNNNNRKKSYGNGKSKKPCGHCGWKNHTSSSCKYKDSECHSCGRTGHLANICKQKDKNNH
ncbi:uncharacterized protein LOC129571479 [Sitodiplosis mosellana]|uniref:uncharacterized protein LOC129571479 n=1 Tax=Sitodiplosis mosellana TaxID=263140 RepID=UPI002444D895|nr:uncharacterized protein LOC129571479 [Sitodiplosis mosellana]